MKWLWLLVPVALICAAMAAYNIIMFRRYSRKRDAILARMAENDRRMLEAIRKRIEL